MILGLVLAGGKSTRFGSDKALARLDGHTLLSQAVDTISGWADYVVVAGRETAPAPTMPDWPHADMGPLGGIASALHYARDESYASVLSMGVDTFALPDNLPELLSSPPCYVESQPIIGHWPATDSTIASLEAILEGNGRHSMIAFAEAIGARSVKLAAKPANINTPADLLAAEKHHGI